MAETDSTGARVIDSTLLAALVGSTWPASTRGSLRPHLGGAQIHSRLGAGCGALLVRPHGERRLRSLYIARRLLAIASEDVGNADPRAMQVALSAWDCFHRIGPAEGERAIAQAIVYLACAPKSNAVYTAWKAALHDAKNLLTSRCRYTCAMRRPN